MCLRLILLVFFHLKLGVGTKNSEIWYITHLTFYDLPCFILPIFALQHVLLPVPLLHPMLFWCMQAWNTDKGLDRVLIVNFIFRGMVWKLTHLVWEWNLVSDQSKSNTFQVFQVHHWLHHGTGHTLHCWASLPMLSEALLLPAMHARVLVVSQLEIGVEHKLSPTNFLVS